MTYFVYNRGGQRIWSEEGRNKLAELWPDNTTAECARLLGTSRDSANKQAQRMGLPRKEMPINLQAMKAGNERARQQRTSIEDTSQHAKRAAALAPIFSALSIPPAHSCQWPLTERRPWLFCEEILAKGSYCAEHAGLAFVGLPSRRT